MLSESIFTERPVRLALRIDVGIAAMRLLLCGALLLALLIDPAQPAQSPTITFGVLATYAIASALILGWTWLGTPTPRADLPVHAADLVVLVSHLTGGATGPAFVLFTFALVSAALRWGARGAATTACVALVSLAVATGFAEGGLQFDAVGAVVLSIHLLVVALLIGYLAWRRDLAHSAVARERESLARELHNGLLQDLTAVGLHLEALARTLPDAQLATTKSLATLIREHQARVRAFATRTPDSQQNAAAGLPDRGASR